MIGQFGPNLGLPGHNFIHTYPATDGTYVVDHSECCRTETLENNGGMEWRISTLVKIQMNNPILRSPVVNTLPIVPVRWAVANAQYQLSATPITTDAQLSFSMATSKQLGDNTEVHPGTLTIANQTTGLMNMDTRNLEEGSWWTTQQIVTDVATGIYVPIDYIILVKKLSTFCHPSCSNKLTPCASNAKYAKSHPYNSQCSILTAQSNLISCLNCNGGPSTTCVSSAPELISTDSTQIANVTGILVPAQGETIDAQVGSTLRIDIVAHDSIVNDPTKPVRIYVGSLPAGASLTSQRYFTSLQSNPSFK